MEKRDNFLASIAGAMAGADKHFNPKAVAEKSLELADELLKRIEKEHESIAEIKQKAADAVTNLSRLKGSLATLLRDTEEKAQSYEAGIEELRKLSEKSSEISLEIKIATKKGELEMLKAIQKKIQSLI